MSNMTTTTGVTCAPARVLREAWETALERHRQRDTVATLQVEAATYDALVDYVETNGLNCTDIDPRGGHDAGCEHSVCEAGAL